MQPNYFKKSLVNCYPMLPLACDILHETIPGKRPPLHFIPRLSVFTLFQEAPELQKVPRGEFVAD